MAIALGLVGCGVSVESVPSGQLARVGNSLIGPEDLATASAEFGAYGQARFRGGHGQRALLEATIMRRLLELEADDAGYRDDPRVKWSVVEELAALELAAELERRLPRADVAADEARLEAYWSQHVNDFAEGERRSIRVATFDKLAPAKAALESVRAGETALEDHGELTNTPLMKRNDGDFPMFHRFVFDAALGEGDLLAEPVISGRRVLVGRIHEVRKGRGLEDPDVRAQVVDAVYAQMAESVKEQLWQELEGRYPDL